MTKAKPYAIPKHIVWDAHQKVKANRGAAGVDGQSLMDFEKDLKSNLYKLWNRMSSGSYFPPPVRLVEIPGLSGILCQPVLGRLVEVLGHPVFKHDREVV
jgi:retron-type reverse transcriptase